MQTERSAALTKTADRGGVAEWLKAPVLKTGFPKGNVGSNPTPSVSKLRRPAQDGPRYGRTDTYGDTYRVQDVDDDAQ